MSTTLEYTGEAKSGILHVRKFVREVKSHLLRRLEEKRKFTFHRLPSERRKEILSELRRELDREEVKLAVVYGGFTSSNLFRDIDVAIFTGFSVPLEKEMEYCEELSRTPN